MHNRPSYLFKDQSLSDYIYQTLQSVQSHADQIPKDQFMVSSENELKEHLYQSLCLESLILHTDKAVMEQRETRVSVHDWGETVSVPGTAVEIEIPYTGPSMLWKCQPSTVTSSPPIGDICNNRQRQPILRIRIQKRQNAEQKEFQSEYQRSLEQIEKYLSWTNKDVSGLNRQLPDQIERAIKSRRERLEKHEGLSTILNIPMKSRDGAPSIDPIRVSRRITKPLPAPPASGYEPEPGISEDVFEDILSMIRHEGRSFETTPKTFSKFDEEELRDIVIAHLNGHFEGGATGETFRKSGKTDIRIEDNERNAFVGECKIWRGAKQIADALDQLSGYLTWRDCKASLIVFNTKVAGFTGLLDKLPEAISKYPLILENQGAKGNGEWRYLFRSKEDEARKVIIHVFIFNLYAS
jgi:hypothetical protein